MRSFLACITLMMLWVNTQSSLLKFEPHESEKGSTNICPDKSECTDQETCCQVSETEWACCPYPNAVCCDDMEHCCPNGYKCDLEAQTCVQKDGDVISWSKKLPASALPQDKMTDALSISRDRSVTCPDQKSQCMDNQTCCQQSSGQWACCPVPKAVCCLDHEHCCPESYRCDPARGMCIKASLETLLKISPMFLPWLNYKPTEGLSIVKCDDQTACQDGQTCCKAPGGGYACCPIPKAVCCQDRQHCCPKGYTCEPATGMCLKANDGKLITLTWSLVEKNSNTVSGKESDVQCDTKVSCPDGYTCCKMSTGEWGCCAWPEAVCCSDGLHCCPNGYTCNLSAGTCDRFLTQIPWSTKIPAILHNSAPDISVIQSVGKSCGGGAWCKHGSTCCESKDGNVRGCCSVENAVCCGDGLHCCPSDTTCDAGSGMCRSVDSSLAFTWQVTRHVDGFGGLRAIDPAPTQSCPDNSTCPSTNTCCQLSSKQYSCCPYEMAVCCKDQIHCCPHDMTCDIEHSRCVQEGLSIPWNLFTRNHAKHPSVIERDLRLTLSKDTCPDLTSICAENTTCCLMQSGAYGCCPHKNAVCCSDKLHCCPYGTTCDIAKQDCVASVSNNNKQDEIKNQENKKQEDDHENDIPFPIMNPYRRFN